jgi:hypothetical protein
MSVAMTARAWITCTVALAWIFTQVAMLHAQHAIGDGEQPAKALSSAAAASIHHHGAAHHDETIVIATERAALAPGLAETGSRAQGGADDRDAPYESGLCAMACGSVVLTDHQDVPPVTSGAPRYELTDHSAIALARSRPNPPPDTLV